MKNDWCTNPQNGWALQYIQNPANERVAFRYDLSRSFQVKLQIINKDKEVVRLLVDELQPAGAFMVTWALRNDKGDRVKNGFYRAQFFIHGTLNVKVTFR
ncbi:hypothetical protein GWO43_11140 [candidate division KSB1 bacterium]|nr:hypothetical protein [candidate division KSB1 bacterium]NIS24495.1 hypothetical protein [candidate division KSB1 bacterium]NIT71423.1 hypothetical protein [candidate division KSB1 bacterium]NIV69631.1 hypothetical protein [Phycisphaerae bacterium]NIX71103.1 hypothetical protein [candidate division KSB1 bacterium]